MIDEKNAAIQSALKSENQVKEAEANAKIAIAKAHGEAEAMKIQADGEAYYNRTVAASLNELLVRQYAIEKWNGELPTYNGGGMTPFINVK
jgi:regulator of protease activity HflC (stomatin/prohibitin superfamily)